MARKKTQQPQLQPVIQSLKFRGKQLNMALVPEPFNLMDEPESLLKEYAIDLLLRLKTPAQTQCLLYSVFKDRAYVNSLVTAELEELNKDKTKLFEQLVLRGLAATLEQNNIGTYFKGLSLLKDTYGIARNLSATIKDDRTDGISPYFLKVKAGYEAQLEAEILEDDSLKDKE